MAPSFSLQPASACYTDTVKPYRCRRQYILQCHDIQSGAAACLICRSCGVFEQACHLNIEYCMPCHTIPSYPIHTSFFFGEAVPRIENASAVRNNPCCHHSLLICLGTEGRLPVFDKAEAQMGERERPLWRQEM